MQTPAAASHLSDRMASHAHTGVRGFGQRWMGVWDGKLACRPGRRCHVFVYDKFISVQAWLKTLQTKCATTRAVSSTSDHTQPPHLLGPAALRDQLHSSLTDKIAV
jgi:hypothetical protein